MRVALFAAAIAALFLFPAKAQELLAQGQHQARGCAQSCLSEYRLCGISNVGEKTPAVCDTGFVRCRLHCQDCASGFARCALSVSNPMLCKQSLETCRSPHALAGVSAEPLITFGGGDGLSPEEAIIIKGARDTREGLEAQAFWVGKNFWGWRRAGQSVSSGLGRIYERVDYMTPQGVHKPVFFDITEFYGRF